MWRSASVHISNNENIFLLLFLVLHGTIVVGDSGERTISQDVTFYYPHILPRGNLILLLIYALSVAITYPKIFVKNFTFYHPHILSRGKHIALQNSKIFVK